MKPSTLLLLPLIVCCLSGCRVDRYVYVAEDPIVLYEFPSFAEKPVVTALVGDTVSTTGAKQIQLGGTVPVEYAGYRFYSPYARARFIRIVKVRRRKDAPMPGMVYATRSQAQSSGQVTEVQKANSSASELSNGFGLGFGFGTEKAFQLEALYKRNRSMFRAGYLHQFNGQLGKLEGSRLANYGTTVIGRDTYFTAFLAGYHYWLTNKLALGADACMGSTGAYRNYSDKRFKAGGYHMITSSELAYGFGGRVDYLATKLLLLSAGYNTLLGGNLSISFVPYGYN